MTHSSRQPILILFLAGYLLVFGATIAGAITSHSIHKEHDQQTHTQSWCGWMCQAGTGIHTLSIHLDPTFDLVTLPDVLVLESISRIPTFTVVSRGPPSGSI